MRGFKCLRFQSISVPKPLTIPDINDEVTLARYPFLPQARGWISGLATKHSIDIDELLDGVFMERARIERVPA